MFPDNKKVAKTDTTAEQGPAADKGAKGGKGVKGNDDGASAVVVPIVRPVVEEDSDGTAG